MPVTTWCVAQAESFVKHARHRGLPVKQVQHDLDTKFTKLFDQQLKSYRVQNAYRSPNTNAFVERFIQSIGQECLDRFVMFGQQHLDALCAAHLAHYHIERPHQGEGIDNER
jgi:putative transposase